MGRTETHLPPEQQQTHPARWCLAEVCNVHSPAIEIEPSTVCCWRGRNTVAADFGSWLEQHGAALQGGDQHIVLAGAGAEITFDAANTPDPLAVGTTEHFIGDYLAQNPGVTVDYIHGAAAARAMAADPAKPARGPSLCERKEGDRDHPTPRERRSPPALLGQVREDFVPSELRPGAASCG